MKNGVIWQFWPSCYPTILKYHLILTTAKHTLAKPRDQNAKINNKEERSNDVKPNKLEKQQQSNPGGDFDKTQVVKLQVMVMKALGEGNHIELNVGVVSRCCSGDVATTPVEEKDTLEF